MRPILSRRQPSAEPFPFVAAVVGLVDAAFRAALDDLPRTPVLVVHRRVERGRRLAVDDEVDRADAVVDVEHLLPRLAAVGRAEDAAFLVLREQVAHRGDVHHVGVRRMNDDARDVVGVGESHELPGRAGVGGLEDALARVRRARVRLIAGAHPDDVRIGGRDGDGAHGRGADAVGDRRPRRAGVRRLPEAAAAGGGVDRVEMVVDRRFRHGDRRDPGGRAKRADVTERQRVDDRVDGRRGLIGSKPGSRRGQGGDKDEPKRERAESHGRIMGEIVLDGVLGCPDGAPGLQTRRLVWNAGLKYRIEKVSLFPCQTSRTPCASTAAGATRRTGDS